jgi:hypothetical protein
MLPPAPHPATLWPGAADVAAMPTWPLGPVLQLHLLPHHHLLKAAVQRLVSDKLRGSTGDQAVDEPFLHHWALTVRIKRNVPLHHRTRDDEAYTLQATKQRNGLTHVQLQAPSEWGALLGLHSLRQLLAVTHTAGQHRGVLHLAPLSERPEYAHRAVRIPPETPTTEIRRIMDESAQLKFNVVHWALQATPDRLAHPIGAVRLLVQYAYHRGLQVLFEWTPWADAVQQQQFLRAFMPLSTSPLLHAEGLTLPDDLPHTRICPQPTDRWQPGDVVQLEVPQNEAAYAQLAALRLVGAQGAVLPLPANLLVLLQVAALLWAPATVATTSDDPRVLAATLALWYDQGLEAAQPHTMDVELLRLRESHYRPDGRLVE